MGCDRTSALYLHAHRRLSVSQTELKVQQSFRLHTQLCTQKLHQSRVMFLRLQMEDKAKHPGVSAPAFEGLDNVFVTADTSAERRLAGLRVLLQLPRHEQRPTVFLHFPLDSLPTHPRSKLRTSCQLISSFISNKKNRLKLIVNHNSGVLRLTSLQIQDTKGAFRFKLTATVMCGARRW